MDVSNLTNAPPDREPIHCVCGLLSRAEREVRRALTSALSGADLSMDEFLLLAACDAPALPGQTELAAATALSAAQTSTLLDRLRLRNWLTPERDRVDRRRQVWALTEQGRVGLARAWQSLEPQLASLQQRLLPAAWEALAQSLEELARRQPTDRRRCA